MVPSSSSSSSSSAVSYDPIFCTIRSDAEAMCREASPSDGDDSSEPFLDIEASKLLPGVLCSSVFKWNTLEECLAFHLASKLKTDSAPLERWHNLLLAAFTKGTCADGSTLVKDALRRDLIAVKKKDPACPSLGHAFLFFKGFHGIQIHRASNWLWRCGKKSLASLLQSRGSEVFGMDIHPAAKIGCGVLIDHATGVVIGETARVGDGCTLLHGVTLGGNGKQTGDRHPKLGSNVLVGAGASIIGNIKVGDGAKIGAAAIVLNDIPAFSTAVGCPAKVISTSKEKGPASVRNFVFGHQCDSAKLRDWECMLRASTVTENQTKLCVCTT